MYDCLSELSLFLFGQLRPEEINFTPTGTGLWTWLWKLHERLSDRWKSKECVAPPPTLTSLILLERGKSLQARHGKPSKLRQDKPWLLKSKGQVYVHLRVFEGRWGGAEPLAPPSTQGLWAPWLLWGAAISSERRRHMHHACEGPGPAHSHISADVQHRILTSEDPSSRALYGLTICSQEACWRKLQPNVRGLVSASEHQKMRTPLTTSHSVINTGS